LVRAAGDEVVVVFLAVPVCHRGQLLRFALPLRLPPSLKRDALTDEELKHGRVFYPSSELNLQETCLSDHMARSRFCTVSSAPAELHPVGGWCRRSSSGCLQRHCSGHRCWHRLSVLGAWVSDPLEKQEAGTYEWEKSDLSSCHLVLDFSDLCWSERSIERPFSINVYVCALKESAAPVTFACHTVSHPTIRWRG
jgi:hypothetical protein